MLTAASVIPASTSAATSDRRTGSSPPITGTACSRARRERPRESGTVTSACFPGGSALGNHLAAAAFHAVAPARSSFPAQSPELAAPALGPPGDRRLTRHRQPATGGEPGGDQ